MVARTVRRIIDGKLYELHMPRCTVSKPKSPNPPMLVPHALAILSICLHKSDIASAHEMRCGLTAQVMSDADAHGSAPARVKRTDQRSYATMTAAQLAEAHSTGTEGCRY